MNFFHKKIFAALFFVFFQNFKFNSAVFHKPTKPEPTGFLKADQFTGGFSIPVLTNRCHAWWGKVSEKRDFGCASTFLAENQIKTEHGSGKCNPKSQCDNRSRVARDTSLWPTSLCGLIHRATGPDPSNG
jgi:hypothetical protein